MYGTPPPARSEGVVVTLRVLFAVSGFLTCGLLACVPLFRIAILRGNRADWLLAWLSIPLSIAALAVVGSLPETDPRTDVAMVLLILLGAAAAAYFLVVDIRHHRPRAPFPPYAPQPHLPPYAQPTRPAQPGYGYPAPAGPPPHARVTRPQGPQVAAQSQPQPPYGTPRPVPPPPPAGHRIDQVRAELDELSDLLRNDHDGHGDPRAGRGDLPR